MPNARVGAMPQPNNYQNNYPPGRGTWRNRGQQGGGLSIEDLKRQTALRLAQEGGENSDAAVKSDYDPSYQRQHHQPQQQQGRQNPHSHYHQPNARPQYNMAPHTNQYSQPQDYAQHHTTTYPSQHYASSQQQHVSRNYTDSQLGLGGRGGGPPPATTGQPQQYPPQLRSPAHSQQQQQQQQRRRRTAAPTKHNLLTHPLKAKLRNGTEVPVLSLNPPYKDEGTKWVDANATTVGTGNDGVNAKPLQTQWYHKTSFNEKVCKENEKFSEMSRIQSFLHMMPPAQLQTMLDLTNTPSPTRTNAPMSSFQSLRMK
mmetsp:Transcript_8855/g.15026  ORF Transcript_8855/g.15026 Transcript_8855/m.15026 type:complete len:313 (-) Transcript_8855:392-1330(-)